MYVGGVFCGSVLSLLFRSRLVLGARYESRPFNSAKWYVRFHPTWTCFTCTYSYLERCIFGDVRCPCRNISTHEQHGRTSGMSLAMVHYFSRIRLLVLHHCMVVSKIVPPRFESLHATSDDYVPQSCYPRAFQVMYARILQKVSNTGDQQRSHSMEPLVKPKSRY